MAKFLSDTFTKDLTAAEREIYDMGVSATLIELGYKHDEFRNQHKDADGYAAEYLKSMDKYVADRLEDTISLALGYAMKGLLR